MSPRGLRQLPLSLRIIVYKNINVFFFFVFPSLVSFLPSLFLMSCMSVKEIPLKGRFDDLRCTTRDDNLDFPIQPARILDVKGLINGGGLVFFRLHFLFFSSQHPVGARQLKGRTLFGYSGGIIGLNIHVVGGGWLGHELILRLFGLAHLRFGWATLSFRVSFSIPAFCLFAYVF